ncbi:dual specificity protein phosphatase 22 isoform 5-T5 [Callospermophilus lateralis]|uniref:dual specificity protein phosphatase 22 isoform X4 n=1 Tax=Callospermophilus lateralis TaxID=76772 RepID=UPI004038535C
MPSVRRVSRKWVWQVTYQAVLGLTVQILPGLYIGNFKDARDAEQLSKNKVTHILSVHDSARPMLEGVKYLCIPAADSPSQNLTRHFKESIKFIHECRLQGEGCLVHCHHCSAKLFENVKPTPGSVAAKLGWGLQECDAGDCLYHDRHGLWLGGCPAHGACREILCQPQSGLPEAAPGV